MKIIRLIAKKSTINLNVCRIYCPEISSGTFHSTLNKLVKHGLVRKNSKENELTTYTKTNEFMIEKAVEVIKAKSAVGIKPEKVRRLEENILRAINSIVDPATGLTFAEMKMAVTVKEMKPGFIQIEFIPSFCPLAAEFTTYINNATLQVSGIEKILVRCSGHVYEHKNNWQIKINQRKLASPKGLLEYLERP